MEKYGKVWNSELENVSELCVKLPASAAHETKHEWIWIAYLWIFISRLCNYIIMADILVGK